MSNEWKKLCDVIKSREFLGWDSFTSALRCPVCNEKMTRFFKEKTQILYCKFCDIAPSGTMDLSFLDENSGEKPVEKV